MGLFSFFKNLGSKKIEAEAAKNDAAAKAAELRKEDLMESIVNSAGLKVKDLDVDIQGTTVVVYGETEAEATKNRVLTILGGIDGVESVDNRISVVIPEPTEKTYTVKSGDTLSKIAKQYYGDPMKYKQIFEANQPLLKDPNLIYPGQVLKIPDLG